MSEQLKIFYYSKPKPKQPPKLISAKRREKRPKADCLQPAEKEVLALMLAGQYLAAAILTQKYWLKHIDTVQLALIYEEAIQTKMYKKAVGYCHHRLSRNLNLPFILYELTKNQGPPAKGVGSWSLRPEKLRGHPDKPSGDSKFFSGNC